MSVLIDLVGSVVIFGLLFLAMFAVDHNVNSFALQNRMDLNNEESLVTMISMLDYDLRKAGYGVPTAGGTMQQIDSSYVKFLADIDNNGSVDVVEYSISPTSQMGGTINPRDRKLIRKVNGQQIVAPLGLTRLRLRYFAADGTENPPPNLVKSIEVILRAEGPFPIDTTYAWATVDTKIYPRNLQRP